MSFTSERQKSSTHDTVLFIENHSEDLGHWSSRLQKCSNRYACVTVSSAEGALVFLRHQRVDCVVLDLDVPQSSGFELLLTLIPDRQHPRIPVIVLTRLRNPALHRMTLENGAHACLVKEGTSPQDLDHAIQHGIVMIPANIDDGPPIHRGEEQSSHRTLWGNGGDTAHFGRKSITIGGL
jgi:DNA-binding NarL/FixJ family response regulator